MGKSIVLSFKLYISYMGGGSNVNYYKSVQHPIPTREHPGDFQNKLASFPFI